MYIVYVMYVWYMISNGRTNSFNCRINIYTLKFYIFSIFKGGDF